MRTARKEAATITETRADENLINPNQKDGEKNQRIHSTISISVPPLDLG